MMDLLYKEYKLSINKFFILLPFILGLLMFIPQWIFMLIFMYFFWVTVPNLYAGYLSQKDYEFCLMLPVSKKEIVVSKVTTLLLLEILHVIAAVIFGITHNLIYGSYNFFLDITPALFGYAFIMFGLFNLVFLPKYFKTAYYYGKAVILGTIVTLIFGLGVEALVFAPSFTSIVEPNNTMIEVIYLIAGIIIFGALSFIALKRSIRNYQSI